MRSNRVKVLIIPTLGLFVLIIFLIAKDRYGANLERASTAKGSSAMVGSEPNLQSITLSHNERVTAGVVLDGVTSVPLEGVEVSVFLGRAVPFNEAQRDLMHFWFSEGKRKSVGSLWLPDRAGAKVLSENEPGMAFDRPEQGSAPLASHVTDTSGHFKISSNVNRGIIQCKKAGYITECYPLLGWMLQSQIVITLFKPTVIRGRLLDGKGRAHTSPLSLAFFSVREGQAQSAVWECLSLEDGSFSVEVGSHNVVPKVRTPGWKVTDPQPIDPYSKKPIDLIIESVPILHVTHAETGKEVDDFYLLMESTSRESVYRAGRYSPPDGKLALLHEIADPRQFAGQSFKISVWRDDAEVWTREFIDIRSEGVIDAQLVKGAPARISGRVIDRGLGVKNVRLELRQGTFQSRNWKLQDLQVITGAKTGDDGSFSISAPHGSYILHVARGSMNHCVHVTAPTWGMDIELSTLCSLAVKVLRSDGQVVSGQHVIVEAVDLMRRWNATTSATGIAEFSDLPPGVTRAAVAVLQFPAPNDTVRPDGKWAEVSLAPGTRETIELLAEAGETVKETKGKLRIRGEPSFEGMTIRSTSSRSATRAEIAPDGSFQVAGGGTLLVESQSGRLWIIPRPTGVRENWDIDLEADGPTYKGTVHDWKTGAPLSRVTLWAVPQSPSGIWTGFRTGESGEFLLTGLTQGPYHIQCDKNDYHGVKFVPKKAPNSSGQFLRVKLPRLAGSAFEISSNRTIQGTLTLPKPPEQGRLTQVQFHAIVDVGDGSVRLLLDSAVAMSNAQAEFLVTAPFATTYDILVVTSYGRPDAQVKSIPLSTNDSNPLLVNLVIP